MRVHVPLILGSRADGNNTSSCISAVHEFGGIEWDARWKKGARSGLEILDIIAFGTNQDDSELEV